MSVTISDTPIKYARIKELNENTGLYEYGDEAYPIGTVDELVTISAEHTLTPYPDGTDYDQNGYGMVEKINKLGDDLGDANTEINNLKGLWKRDTTVPEGSTAIYSDASTVRVNNNFYNNNTNSNAYFARMCVDSGLWGTNASYTDHRLYINRDNMQVQYFPGAGEQMPCHGTAPFTTDSAKTAYLINYTDKGNIIVGAGTLRGYGTTSMPFLGYNMLTGDGVTPGGTLALAPPLNYNMTSNTFENGVVQVCKVKVNNGDGKGWRTTSFIPSDFKESSTGDGWAFKQKSGPNSDANARFDTTAQLYEVIDSSMYDDAKWRYGTTANATQVFQRTTASYATFPDNFSDDQNIWTVQLTEPGCYAFSGYTELGLGWSGAYSTDIAKSLFDAGGFELGYRILVKGPTGNARTAVNYYNYASRGVQPQSYSGIFWAPADTSLSTPTTVALQFIIPDGSKDRMFGNASYGYVSGNGNPLVSTSYITTSNNNYLALYEKNRYVDFLRISKTTTPDPTRELN